MRWLHFGEADMRGADEIMASWSSVLAPAGARVHVKMCSEACRLFIGLLTVAKITR